MKKSTNLNYLALLLLFVAGFAGCRSDERAGQDDHEEEIDCGEEFCRYLTVVDINKTIPAVNAVLKGLPGEADAVRALASWMGSCPCVRDATVAGENQIVISFDEDEITVYRTLKLRLTRPAQAVGYREYVPPRLFTVSFNSNGGTGAASQTVKEGDRVQEPSPAPALDGGYVLGGWYTDNYTFRNRWDFRTHAIASDTTLHAKWEAAAEPSIEQWPYHFYCQWTNMEYNDNVVIINDPEELEKYTACPANDTFRGLTDVIDFSKHSLLLASGIADDSISFFASQNLIKHPGNQYVLEMEVLLRPNLAVSGKQWVCAFRTDKLDGNSSIKLDVTTLYEDERKEVTIMEHYKYTQREPPKNCLLKKIILSFSPIRLPYPNVVIAINSKEEYEEYFDCSADIDFQTNTLLLSASYTSGFPASILDVRLTQTANKGHYELYYLVTHGALTSIDGWASLVVTERLPLNSKINLIIEDI